MRELRKPIPTEVMKKIRPMLSTYGARKVLAEKAGVTYDQLTQIKQYKKATPTVIAALTKVNLNGK